MQTSNMRSIVLTHNHILGLPQDEMEIALTLSAIITLAQHNFANPLVLPVFVKSFVGDLILHKLEITKDTDNDFKLKFENIDRVTTYSFMVNLKTFDRIVTTLNK